VVLSSSTQLVNLSDAVLKCQPHWRRFRKRIIKANLYAARLGRVSALGAQLQLANLTKSDWQDLSKADLHSANLRSADFSTTRLTGNFAMPSSKRQLA